MRPALSPSCENLQRGYDGVAAKGTLVRSEARGWEVICDVTAARSCLVYSFGHVWGHACSWMCANYNSAIPPVRSWPHDWVVHSFQAYCVLSWAPGQRMHSKLYDNIYSGWHTPDLAQRRQERNVRSKAPAGRAWYGSSIQWPCLMCSLAILPLGPQVCSEHVWLVYISNERRFYERWWSVATGKAVY